MSVASSTFRAFVTRSFTGVKYLWRNRTSVLQYLALVLGKKIQSGGKELNKADLGEFANHYQLHIQPLFSTLETKRITILRWIRFLSWTCTILLILQVITIFDVTMPREIAYYAFLLLPLLIILNIFGLIFIRYSYVLKLKKELLPKILMYFSDDIEFIEHPEIELDLAIKYGIIPEFYRYTIDDGIIGKYQNVEFNLFETELINQAFIQKEVYDKTTFKGIIATIAMNKNFMGHTIVKHQPKRKYLLEQTTPIAPIKGMELVRLEDPLFESKFEVFSTNQIEARYLLTPSFMENILNLNEVFGGTQMQCSFLEEKFFLMIESNEDYFEPGSIFTPLNFTDHIKPLFDEVSFLLQIITTLKLNQDTRL